MSDVPQTKANGAYPSVFIRAQIQRKLGTCLPIRAARSSPGQQTRWLERDWYIIFQSTQFFSRRCTISCMYIGKISFLFPVLPVADSRMRVSASPCPNFISQAKGGDIGAADHGLSYCSSAQEANPGNLELRETPIACGWLFSGFLPISTSPWCGWATM
jgi:hypothetical protein